MNNYNDSKKQLDEIRNEYDCKGELIFRTAIQYVLDYGKAFLNDEEWCTDQFIKIDNKHDKAETEGVNLWITRGFEKSLLECAIEIAKVSTVDIIMYLQHKWLFYGNYGEISYDRALEIIQDCINYMVDEGYQTSELREKTYQIGLTDSELEYLNFDWILEEEDE